MQLKMSRDRCNELRADLDIQIERQQRMVFRDDYDADIAAERERCAKLVLKYVLAGRVADMVAIKIRSGESI